jgi:protein SCO1
VRRLYLVAVSSAAIVGIAAGVVLHNTFESSRAQAEPALPALYGQVTWKSGQSRAPLFTLRDQYGRRIRLGRYRGRSIVLAFMDSLCKSECPIEARQFAAAIRPLAPADRPRLLIVSVDLADSPVSVAKAARHWHLPTGYEWLLGTRAELAPVWRAYNIFVKPVNGDIVHSDAFYVIDANGDERAGFVAPFSPGLLTLDLRRLG